MHEGLRPQKTAGATGARPGVLTEPEPQGGAVTVGYGSAPGPLLSTPLLADTAAEAVDARTVKFLLQKTLARKKEEEEEEEEEEEVAKQQEEKHEAKMKLLNDRVRHDLPLTEAEWAARRQWMGLVPYSSSSGRRRKRKKRRKRKAPRCALLRFPRARAVRSWKSEHIPAPCLWQSLCCLRSTGMLVLFLGDDFMVAPAVSGSTVDTYLRQSTVAFGRDASGKCRCILRFVWSVRGYILMRQFPRLLVRWCFYGPLYLAVVCSTLSVPEEYNTWIILGDDFRMDAVFISLLGSSVDTSLRQFTEAFGVFHLPRSSSTFAVVCAGWFCWRFHRCSSWTGHCACC